MRIFFLYRTSCIQSYRYSFPVRTSYRHFISVESLLKPSLLNRSLYQISVRHLSWEGFYTSISTSSPVVTFGNFLLNLHTFSELPWWAVIMFTTLGIRSFIVFPLAVHQSQVIAHIINMNNELKKMAPELNKEVNIAAKMYGWNEAAAKKIFKKNMKRHYQKIILRDNCHPFKIVLLAIFQIPVWICFSISLRSLAGFSLTFQQDDLLYQQFKSEGTLWFKDMTIPDMFFIPFLLAIVNLVLIEISSLIRIGKISKLQKVLTYLMRFVVIAVTVAAAANPSAVSFYWLCSSTFGLVQSLLLMIPRVRRILRIPHTTLESATPFKNIALNFRKRIYREHDK